MYIDILKENLHASAEKLSVRQTFKMYQDNDPKHRRGDTRIWLLYNCPKVIDTPSQPPISQRHRKLLRENPTDYK